MTSILALETSGALCSVAVDVDGSCFELTHHVDRKHNEILPGMIDEACRQAGVRRADLDAVAFGRGPGSFTGVRIAAATAQGIALALDIRVLPITSSEALVEAYRRMREPDALGDRLLLTSIRSRAQLYYLAAFAATGDRLQRRLPDRLISSADELEALKVEKAELICVGAQPEWWPGAVFDSDIHANASDLVSIARPRLAAGAGADAEQALPLYVSGDTPWQPSVRKTGA